MSASRMKCKACGKEFTSTQEATLHRVKVHGDVDSVKHLNTENKDEMMRKVIVRNLHLSGIQPDIIALQVDLDVSEVMKIIEEVKKEWSSG